ncbi:isochorismatase family protein [bacterium]|nr:isochorismatase family protein [bacterium]MDC0277088.1 isochorismatase family protein [bacterium]
MKQRGITNVIILGVHTNMCVLGRPFSIRQMVYQGQNVALVRDLTDTMYNPRSSPLCLTPVVPNWWSNISKDIGARH